MIRPFLSKALQPPEEQAVINAMDVLHQLVSNVGSQKTSAVHAGEWRRAMLVHSFWIVSLFIPSVLLVSKRSSLV